MLFKKEGGEMGSRRAKKNDDGVCGKKKKRTRGFLREKKKECEHPELSLPVMKRKGRWPRLSGRTRERGHFGCGG